MLDWKLTIKNTEGKILFEKLFDDKQQAENYWRRLPSNKFPSAETITIEKIIPSTTTKITTMKHNKENTATSITITWGVQDVLHQAKQSKVKITRGEAIEVLSLLKMNHDASVGINWDVISDTITLYKEDKKFNHETR